MMEAIENDSPIALYCSFWVGRHCFAVPSNAVSEVHTPVPVTRVPGLKSTVSGYVNLRGQLYLVLDPGELLIGAPIADGSAGLIVFRPEVGEAFAICVDQVGDMLSIHRAKIHTPKARADDIDLSDDSHNRESLISGRATMETCLVTLIDASKLLPAALHDGGA
mgnify:CR=1 FL=1